MKTFPVWTRRIRLSGLLLFVTAIIAGPAQTRSFQGAGGTAQISADRSFVIKYGHRFRDAKISALATAIAPQTYASLYLAPRVRLKFFSSSRLSPWSAIGGGYVLYQQSARLSDGQNETDKFLNRGVFDYGAGLDFRLFRFFRSRADVRDFLSGNPDLNVKLNSSTQHNIVASGGVILRF